MLPCPSVFRWKNLTVAQDARPAEGKCEQKKCEISASVKPVTASPAEPVDLVTLGQRLRHLRRAKGMTLDQLSAAVGRAPSQLSLIENGKREPKLSVLQAHRGRSRAYRCRIFSGRRRRAGEPGWRSSWPISSSEPAYAALGLPVVRGGRRLPADALESLVGLHRELTRLLTEQSATPEVARRANAQLRVRDARAGQLLRRDRGGRGQGAAVGAPHDRPAVAARHPRHRRAPRLHPALRATTCPARPAR